MFKGCSVKQRFILLSTLASHTCYRYLLRNTYCSYCSVLDKQRLYWRPIFDMVVNWIFFLSFGLVFSAAGKLTSSFLLHSCSVLSTQICCFSGSGNHKNEQVILSIECLKLRALSWWHLHQIPMQTKAYLLIQVTWHLTQLSFESPLRIGIINS